MFRNLKTKNNKQSVFKDMSIIKAYSKSPGATSTVTKSNERSRLVRCQVCGWICDMERDVRLPKGSYAGFGINQGVVKSTSTYKYSTSGQIKLSTK